MTQFETGDRVTWLFHPRGGYGYVRHVPATVVSVGKKQIAIDAELKGGGTTRTHVRPENLRKVAAKSEMGMEVRLCGFPADRQIVIDDTRHHGSRGVHTFSDQSAAEDYLKALPAQYSGRCYKSENGKWTVAYHRFDVPDPTSNY